MKIELMEKKKQNGDAVSFIFKTPHLIKWTAGQFLFYTFPHNSPDNRGITRYFTISSAPFEQDIVITTRISADKSSTFKIELSNMKIGDKIEITDPDGDFTVEDPKQKYIFISGGIGITPYRSILLDIDHRNSPINATLLYANSDENFVFKDELETLATKHPSFRIKYFVSPRHIEWEDIDKAQQGLGVKPLIYVSGPEPMVEAFEKTLRSMKIPEERIKLDFFPGYDPIE